MKSIKYLYILAMIFPLLHTSCTEDEKINLNEVKDGPRGGFVRFVLNEVPPTVLGVNQINDISYSFAIEDPNENVVSYDLSLYADLSGTRTDTVAVSEITSFPSTLDFTAGDLASLLGVETDAINFGDNFFFSAVVTTDDGREFNGAVRQDFDDLDDDDPSTFTLEGGNVSNDLLDQDGYRAAFEFGFVIACPAFSIADEIPGSYAVIESSFAAFFGETDFDREVIAGPGTNQVTILGGEFPGLGSDDLILTINPNDGSVASINSDGISLPESAGFGVNTYLLEAGLVLPCAGNIIDLTMNFDPLSGNAHKFVLQKQ